MRTARVRDRADQPVVPDAGLAPAKVEDMEFLKKCDYKGREVRGTHTS